MYVRFNRWSQQGIWQKVFAQLAREADNEYAMIDSTIVRAHRSAAGARKKGHWMREAHLKSQPSRLKNASVSVTPGVTAAEAEAD